MYKKIILLLIVLMAGCGMACSDEAEKVEVRTAEIIIKVEPGVIVMPEGDYRAAISEIEINSEALEALNRRFNLMEIERMFARKGPDEEVTEVYPVREARAPEDAESPDIEHTFIFRFPDLTPIDEVIEEYEKLEKVVYAEKNAVLDIF